MYQTLRYEKQENIGILTINRPEALNALNSTVIGDLEQAITEVEKDAELGALIITGEGRSFVAGADIGEQLPLLHARALRNGHVEDLPRHLEGEVHSVVGSSHAGKILVDKSRAGSRRHLHGAYHRRCGRLAGTRPGKQGDR